MDKRTATLAMQAMNGDKQAIAKLAAETLPQLGGQVQNLHAEVEHRRQHEWDADAARQAAMDPDYTVPPEQTIGALSDIYSAVLRVCAYTPVMLTADGSEAQAYDEMWREAMLSLVLTLHNPIIKYGLIGGLQPECREEAEMYLDKMGVELWGTIDALVSEGNINVNDFPADTRTVISEVAEAVEPPEEAD